MQVLSQIEVMLESAALPVMSIYIYLVVSTDSVDLVEYLYI